MHEVVADCGLEAEQRGCHLTIDMAGGHVSASARGNRELLRRAVENVVRNAIRYAPEGTPVVVNCSGREGEIVVSVRDFGPGVTEEALSHLGSPFYRVDPSRDLATGGLGLGLAIARRAIQLHHGLWSVENAGPGLNVTMTVPADVDSSAALT